MNWDAIGAVGEIIGALAVFVTLGYLAVQVAQTRKNQRAESVRATRAERIDFYTSLRDAPHIPEILEKLVNDEPLGYADALRLSAHHAAHWAQLYSAWLQDRLELSGGYNSSMPANFRLAFSIPGSLDWLQELGVSLYPPEFIDEAMQFCEVEAADYRLLYQQADRN